MAYFEDIKKKTEEAKNEISKKIKQTNSLDTIKDEANKKAYKVGKDVQRKAQKTVNETAIRGAKDQMMKGVKSKMMKK